INSIVEVYRKRYPSVKVILTGGYSGWFSRDIKCDMKRRYLTLEGLGMVMYERCREGRNL
ncbi:MAG: hypothetical protein PHI44_05610, partial [Candidatus Ratteibacteria bacterium]|nr:hypothetical protein [Candidatus Ratteibacteria bacterium]